MAEQPLKAAIYLAESVVRSVRQLVGRTKKLFPAVFVDTDMQRFFDPFGESPELVADSKADGVLIDTFGKLTGKGLLDYCELSDIAKLAREMHKLGKEAWVAGSITKEQLPDMWSTGVDVICVRGAACAKDNGGGRFGTVTEGKVRELAQTLADS